MGAENAGRPFLLDGGLEWKAMGFSPREMESGEGRNAAAREIALALGVPPLLLGLPGDNTFKNFEEANLAFWRFTIFPLAKLLNKKPTAGDLEKLALFSQGMDGKLFDVKQEIYRLPDRLLYNIASYYGVKFDSVWNAINVLQDANKISSPAAINLKHAASFATMLRLKSYIYNKGQVDDMSLFVANNDDISKQNELVQQSKIFHLPPEDLEEDGGLFRYYYTALPLHKKLQSFTENYGNLDLNQKVSFFSAENFYNDDYAQKGLIQSRLTQYEKASKHLKQALEIPEYQNDLTLKLELAIVQGYLGKVEDEIETLKNIVKDSVDSINLAAALNLAQAYNETGLYDEGIRIGEQVEEYLENDNKQYGSLYYNNYILQCLNTLGTSYHKKGIVYNNQKDLETAKEYFEKATQLPININGNDSLSGVILNNLSRVCLSLGQYDDARNYAIQALDLRNEYFKGEPHNSYIFSFYVLGECYSELKQYDKAEEYYLESIRICDRIFGDHAIQKDKAQSFCGLGLNYYAHSQNYDVSPEDKKKLLEKALEYCLKAEDLFLKLKMDNHPDMAALQNNIGIIYVESELLHESIACHKKSLQLRRDLGIESDVIESLKSLSSAYSQLGAKYRLDLDYPEAIKHYTEALRYRIDIYKNCFHENVEVIICKLAECFRDHGDYDSSINCYELSLYINKELYPISDYPVGHQQIARTLSNLGNLYIELGNYENAIGFHSQALEMRTSLYPSGDQCVDRSKNNLLIAQITKRILDPFNKLISDKQINQFAKNVALEVSIETIELREFLINYCENNLELNADDLAFNGDSCKIYLGENAINILLNDVALTTQKLAQKLADLDNPMFNKIIDILETNGLKNSEGTQEQVENNEIYSDPYPYTVQKIGDASENCNDDL